MPRCQVGEGTQKQLYAWTDEADCTFLGGAKVFQKNFKCKDGKEEQFSQVEVCVQGDIISGDGFNYATGGAFDVESHKEPGEKTTTRTCHGPLCEGKCYRFQAFDHAEQYLSAFSGSNKVSHIDSNGNFATWMIHTSLYKDNKGLSIARPKNLFLTNNGNSYELTHLENPA